jgi:hypothetical protein
MAGTSDDVLDRTRIREVTGVFHSKKKALELAATTAVAVIVAALLARPAPT